MSGIEQWLRRYACGPGGHDFEATGIRMMPVAQTVQPGRPLDTSTMEQVTRCTRCGKGGWERTLTCEICDHYPAEVAPGRVLVSPNGARLAGLPLCDSCHVELIAGRAPGFAIEREAPDGKRADAAASRDDLLD